MDARRSSSCGPVIPEDGIFITDKGIGKRSEAFHWLMLGYYVYDHKFHELTVHDLEHNINPNGAMSSMHVRGALWKTVPQRYWLAHRGGRNGLEPAQPGLNMEASVMENYDLGPTGTQPGGKSSELTRVEGESLQNGSLQPYSQSQSSSTWFSMPLGKPTHHSLLATSPLDEALETPHRHRQEFTKSRSMTSLSCDSIKSSPARRRSSSVSTESSFAPRKTLAPNNSKIEQRVLEWKMKETMSEDRPLREGEGVHELAIWEGLQARIDSSFAIRSDPVRERCTRGGIETYLTI
ncbi:hypothetical protein EG327_004764 [Venturia inaequalis]|uniref:Uncharacterized protein n=1 Tax=Venturia inaequalis TaxID=5025 RepID=A0A8H3VSW4_VENIN|nr:hypothetical protein EG327_004764 [Venturia inaequalis]